MPLRSRRSDPRVRPCRFLCSRSVFSESWTRNSGHCRGAWTAGTSAIRVLTEEIEKRTTIRLPVSTEWPADTVPAIAVGLLATSSTWVSPGLHGQVPSTGSPGREGYRVAVNTTARRSPTVVVLGADQRGVLFGVGRLLRELHMSRGSLQTPAALSIVSAPQVGLRGHQLGYRPKTNSYDAWDVPMWEQYIRDLAVFGTNAIELIPPRSDDDADSPHFPLPPMEMMVEMSRLAERVRPGRLDLVSGDGPGLRRSEDSRVRAQGVGRRVPKAAAHRRRLRPRRRPRPHPAEAPDGAAGEADGQSCTSTIRTRRCGCRRRASAGNGWTSSSTILKTEPAWLTGVVFGPQVRDQPAGAARARAGAIPASATIPTSPTACACQYPVPDWDVAHALTSQREQINPRPLDEAVIFRALMPQYHGLHHLLRRLQRRCEQVRVERAGMGSGGGRRCEILREYSRYFIGDSYTEAFAQGLLALERNWRGPLAANTSVYTTLEQFQSMERAASPADLAQLALPAGTLPRLLRRVRAQPSPV